MPLCLQGQLSPSHCPAAPLRRAGVEGGDGGGLLLGSREEQLDVLAAILAASDADLAEEDEAEDKDDVANLKKKWV